MIPPILRVMIRQPRLFLEHALNYTDLVKAESKQVVSNTVHKVIGLGLAAMGTLLFLIFAGVAVLVGVMLNQFNWVLVIVPAVPLLLTAIGLFIARKPIAAESIHTFQQHISEDLAIFQDPGKNNHD